ncbi:hypothetical protein [Microvirga aerophila]|uniref:hypothetical protein n=1 Tax=Microvirga aerophila TaxID=670291 RepID=UPI0011BDEF29|nr:hypothetical protein [Microvirga aerophila]
MTIAHLTPTPIELLELRIRSAILVIETAHELSRFTLVLESKLLRLVTAAPEPSYKRLQHVHVGTSLV